MLDKISSVNARIRQNYKLKNKEKKELPPVLKTAKEYKDNFVHNCAKSTPTMLALTALWAVVDSKTTPTPLKKAFTNNIMKFFVPVVGVSSAVIAFLETSGKSKQQK